MTNVFNKYKIYHNYVIIGLVSFVAVVFLPFVGSTAEGAIILPTSVSGWLVFLFSKSAVAVINMLLFYCFMEQAKTNVKDNPRYQEANEILHRNKLLNIVYLAPEVWEAKQYKTKGITVIVCSILSAFALTQAILVFDWIAMLSYIFTILLGLCFGVLQMNISEEYWTNDYYYYAKQIEKEFSNDNLSEQRVQELTGTSTEESAGH